MFIGRNWFLISKCEFDSEPKYQAGGETVVTAGARRIAASNIFLDCRL